MSGELEEGKCSVCGEKDVVVSRKYYHYNVECECCNGNTHFEIVYHCDGCKPKRPRKITIVPHTDKYVD